MFGSVILDVAIGLILVYLLMSLLCSTIREGLEGWLKTRSVHLERGIRELLHDPRGTTLASDVYNHPLVQSLYKGEYDPSRIRTRKKKDGTVEHHTVPSRGHLPSYIPSANFALALLDMVARGPSSADPGTADGSAPVLTLAGIRARVGHIQNPPVQRALLAAIDTANGDLTRAQKNVEAWFDSSMDRVSGWYKRRTQLALFLIGLAVAVLLNVDSFGIAQFLYRDKPARDALVAQAAAVSQDTSFLTQPHSVEQVHASIEGLRLPIGWARDPSGQLHRRSPTGRTVPRGESWIKWIADLLGASGGWLMTAFAVSLGAPFWFDMLNKVMVIRSTVKPHEKSPEESSEDRQAKNAAPPPHLGGGGPPAGGETRGAGGGAPPGPPPAQNAPPQGSTAAGGPRPGGDVQLPADPDHPGADFQPHEWAAGNPQEGTL